MATTSQSLAASAAITITLNSLANNSWRQSVYVDNNTNLYMGAILQFVFRVGTSPTSGTIRAFLYGAETADTNYSAGATGTDVSYTVGNFEGQLVPIHTVVVGTTSDEYFKTPPFNIATLFGNALPRRWGVIVHNNSGVALNASGNEVNYTGLKYASV